MNDRVIAALQQIVGSDFVRTGAAAEAYAIDGKAPGAVVFPGSPGEVAAVLKQAQAAGLAVFPRGGGTQMQLGNVPQRVDIVLGLERLRRVVAHEPADMTVTVEAGITLDALQRSLARSGQYLPVDPPLPPEATVGGIVATRAFGPLRFGFRTISDWLLGTKVVTADGIIAKAGARVVKNVSGYEMGRLYTGSHGTLAVIVEATFKVQPLPRARGALLVPCRDGAAAAAAIQALLSCGVLPAIVELVGPADAAHAPAHRALFDRARGAGASGDAQALLIAGFLGTDEEVDWQLERTQQALAAAGAGAGTVRAGWDEVYPHVLAAHRLPPAAEGEGVTCRAHVLSTDLHLLIEKAYRHSPSGWPFAYAAHAGSGVVRFHWGPAPAAASREALKEHVAAVRARAEASHGRLIVEAAPLWLKESLDAWGEPGPDFFLHQAVKKQMDPRATLSPGRFIGGI